MDKLRKELGKINAVWVGYGGYQDAMFGIGFSLGGDGWGVGDFRGTWGHDPDKYCQWTVADQSKIFAETMRYIIQLCKEAKVTDIRKLQGKPVEIEFEGNALKSWRILKEVL